MAIRRPVQIHFTLTLFEEVKLRRLAEREGVTVSELLRRWIYEHSKS